VASTLSRGRVDATIEWEEFGQNGTRLSFDAEKAAVLVEQMLEFQKTQSMVDKNITLGQLVACGQLLSVKKFAIDEQKLKEPTFLCLDQALADLLSLRSQEGGALGDPLKKMLLTCLDLIDAIWMRIVSIKNVRCWLSARILRKKLTAFCHTLNILI